MDIWQAIVIGVVEGITEYLPVSSTGHILLVQRWLGIPESAAANAYAVCIQAGAILAVANLYWGRLRAMFVGTLHALKERTTGDPGYRLGVNIVVAFLPAAVIGLLFDDWIEQQLFGLWPIVAAWLVGGLAILAVAKWRRPDQSRRQAMPLDELTWNMALRIGLLQCLAMWPGTSRSLVTIVGGVLVGLSLAAAVEFSFLLGMVTLLAATVYKLKDAGPVMLASYSWTTMLVGVVVAWLSALLAVRWMVEYLKSHGLELFGYYRVALALAVAAMIWQGYLAP